MWRKFRTMKKMWCLGMIYNDPFCPWYLISNLPSYLYIWRYFHFISTIAFNCITSWCEILIWDVKYVVWNPFLHLFLSSFFGLKNFLSHLLYGKWKTTSFVQNVILHLISMVTNYFFILARNFSVNSLFHMWIFKIAMATFRGCQC